MTISGIIMFVAGALAIFGWLIGKPILSSIYADYIPMAISTATIFIVFGVLMFFNLLDGRNNKKKPLIVILMVIVSLSGFLHFLGYFIGNDFTLEQYWITTRERLGNIPMNKMSNYTGLLFFISGITVLMKLLGKDRKMLVNLIGNLGMLVAFAGFSASMGYFFGTPFLYSGTIIPLATTTAISFIFMGLGILALAGDKHYMVRKLIGNQASARILRTFIPFLILEKVCGDILEQYIASHYIVNGALISALVSLITIVIGILLILYLTKRIFQSSDKAEAERVKAEEALKESLELRSSLLRTIPFGMDIIDENGTILFMNELMSKNLGEHAIGKKCWQVYREDKTQCLECPLKRNIIIGETHSTESHNILGDKIFEIIHTGLIFDGKKALLEIFNDITERKNSELRLKEYAGELEVANNTKNKLFNIIAHDLRSPFNSILGLTNLLNEKYSVYSEADKKLIVLKLKVSSENAFNLLENLLAWSLAQREGIQVKPESIDMHEITSVQVGILDIIAKTKKINIDNQIAPETFANADRNMITVVVRNLLNNALKFTHTDGKIGLSALKQNGKIEISITDNGVGIPVDILNDLFKTGKTHTTSGTANEKGTGLGLMVCKEFIEINGGEIWVDSVVGKGSRFSFTLPACNQAEKISV